jgi:hypothetical protein
VPGATETPPAPAAPSQGIDAPFELRTPPAADAAPAAATAPLRNDEPETRRRSRAAMLTGIMLAATAPIALLGAVAAANAQSACDRALENDYPDHRLPTSQHYRVEECNGYSVPVYVLGIGGAALAVAGIPLIIYGAKSVAVKTPAASLRVLPWAGRGSGGVSLRLDL